MKHCKFICIQHNNKHSHNNTILLHQSLILSDVVTPYRNFSNFGLFRGDQNILTYLLQWWPMKNSIFNMNAFQ